MELVDNLCCAPTIRTLTTMGVTGRKLQHHCVSGLAAVAQW